ncbi:MAG: hypothetical protein JWO83_3376 [Caulobacteraceae bacterium]|nr:hypothetical protein [Caulobacteraceae bacterium]
MICPHCRTAIRVACQFIAFHMTNDQGQHAVAAYQCPECSGVIVDLVLGANPRAQGFLADPSQGFATTDSMTTIYPRSSSRPPAPPEVPRSYASDYNEAALILADSPKASAALSRRCLQHVLQRELNIKKNNLAQEIDEAIKHVPSHVGEGLDEVRRIGNFAAHPKKSEASGEILEVEPGEAEWSLDVLASLFDHVFVGPAKMRARKAALEAKLKPAGR